MGWFGLLLGFGLGFLLGFYFRFLFSGLRRFADFDRKAKGRCIGKESAEIIRLKVTDEDDQGKSDRCRDVKLSVDESGI